MLRTMTMAALILGLLAGCAAGGNQMPSDAAGLTQDDVAEMSLHQEFDAYRDHYDHMQRLLKDAQLQVHDGEWEWAGGDDLPQISGGGVATLPGADTKNSYDMRSGRLWSPHGATGQERDLQPMIDYFTDQEWAIEQRDITGDHELWGITGDGWQLIYTAQTNGRYSLEIYSEIFWTNDSDALSSAVFGRSTAVFPDRSRPGVFPDFPDWGDPIVNKPKI